MRVVVVTVLDCEDSVLKERQVPSTGKFVLVNGKVGDVLALFSYTNHSAVAALLCDECEGVLAAAGKYEQPKNEGQMRVWYESETCERIYGYDRPQDKVLRDALLEKIETKVLDFFQK